MTIPPTKLLIMCWGYSIHAERRAKIFIDDPTFQVTIVSTYNYNFPGANNIRLIAARIGSTNSVDTAQNTGWQLVIKMMRKVLRRPELTIMADLLILWATMRRVQPEVILLQTLLYPNFLAYALPKTTPQIVTFWNGDITWWAQWNGIERLFKKYLVNYGVRRATAITVNSQTAYNTALTYKVDPKKVHLIAYPGIDLEKFYPRNRQVARQKLGLTAQNILFWPRGLGGYLNSEVFIHALAKVVQRSPDTMAIVFTKVGGPAELVKHQRLAQDLGIDDKISWITEAKFDDMPWFYTSANVMISISSNDSRPNVMLEAMACGTPVIMGDIPATREWITEGVNGYLVPPQDINQLAQTIIKVLTPEQQSTNQAYTEQSLQLVRQQADNQKNIVLIKQLVHRIAHTNDSLQSN